MKSCRKAAFFVQFFLSSESNIIHHFSTSYIPTEKSLYTF